jgi:hypothetical protein
MAGPDAADEATDEATESTRGRRGGDFDAARERRARIAHEIAEELRRAAGELRVPVANLVRGVVDEALEAAERVSDDLGGWVDELVDQAARARRHLEGRGLGRRWHARTRRAEDERPRAAGESPAEPSDTAAGARPDVLGWIAIELERPGSCAVCWRRIARGEDAFLGVGAERPASAIVCPECREARTPAG